MLNNATCFTEIYNVRLDPDNNYCLPPENGRFPDYNFWPADNKHSSPGPDTPRNTETDSHHFLSDASQFRMHHTHMKLYMIRRLHATEPHRHAH